MPKRHPNHTMEYRSELALRARLPAEWIVDKPTDYGRDLMVEIVDGEDPTGLTFGVQLKGTGVRTRSRAMTVRDIRADHMSHWASLPYPVLVVRYLAEIDDLFVYWAHEYGWRQRDNGEGDPIFRFNDADRLDEGRLQRIPLEIARFSAAESGRAVLPPRLCYSTDEVGQAHVGDIEEGLRQALGRGMRFVRSAPDPGDLEVSLTADRLGVTLGGWQSITFHNDEEGTSYFDRPESVVDLLLVAFIVCFDPATAAARTVATKAIARGVPLLEGMPFCMNIASIAFHHSEAALGAELARRMVPIYPSLATLVLQLSLSGDASDDDFALLEQIGLDAIEHAEGATKAETLYNMASFYRGDHRFDLALRYYEMAAAEDSRYTDRPYWWAEIAGTLFLLWRFDESLTAYRRSLSLGAGAQDPEVFQRTADAALHALHLDEAERVLARTPAGEYSASAGMLRMTLERLKQMEGRSWELVVSDTWEWLGSLENVEAVDFVVAAYLRRESEFMLICAVIATFLEPLADDSFEIAAEFASFHLGGNLAAALGDHREACFESFEIAESDFDTVVAKCRRIEEERFPDERPFMVRGLTGEGSEVAVVGLRR